MYKKVENNTQMFRGGVSSTSVMQTVVTDNGVRKSELVHPTLKQHYKVLPDVENFSLEAQLEAGVKLQEVNSNLLIGELPDNLPLPQEQVTEPVEPTE